MKRLDGKVALITGAGRGFGKYMSLAYAVEGANIIAASRTVSEMTRLKESIEAKDGVHWGEKMEVVSYSRRIC